MMKFHTKVYRDDAAAVQRGTYGTDGSTKLTVIGRYGQVLCDATVCMADRRIHPREGYVFIRDWGDNEGVLRALQSAGVIGPTMKTHPSGIAMPNGPQQVADGTLRFEHIIHECRLL
jgi:hypothetical protein